MGLMTLADFRTELESVIGNRGEDPARENLWINLAKNEVEGALDLETNKVCRFFDTIVDQSRYTWPDRFLSVVSIIDRTNVRTLIRSSIDQYNLRRTLDSGDVRWWTKRGNEVLLSPAPDAIVEIEATLILESAALVLDTDRTAHPNYFDNAIYFASVAYAFDALGEEQRGAVWRQKFIGYMQSRMMDYDYETQSTSEPVRVVDHVTDLHRGG